MYSTQHCTQRIVMIALCAIFFSSFLSAMGMISPPETDMTYSEGVKTYTATRIESTFFEIEETIILRYDRQGNVLEDTITRAFDSRTSTFSQQFNKKGQRVFYNNESIQKTPNGIFTNVENATYTYDNEGNVQKEEISSKPPTISSYEYNSDGSIKYKISTAYLKDAEKTAYIYNSDKRLIETKIIQTEESQSGSIESTKYYYDGIVRKLEYPYYTQNKGVTTDLEQISDITQIHLPTVEIVVYKEGLLHFKTFTRGAITQTEPENWQEIIGGTAIYEVYYDNKGNPTSFTAYEAEGAEVIVYYTYEYSNFDERGNWLERKMYYEEKPYSITTRQIEYYD